LAALTAPKLLAVYATIYEELKRRRIDGTGVVATSLPLRLRAAISRNDPAAIDKEFHSWEPLIELPFTRESRDATIEDFGRIVNHIDVRSSCSACRGGRRASPFRAGSRL